jgi:hypothetical protein
MLGASLMKDVATVEKPPSMTSLAARNHFASARTFPTTQIPFALRPRLLARRLALTMRCANLLTGNMIRLAHVERIVRGNVGKPLLV